MFKQLKNLYHATKPNACSCGQNKNENEQKVIKQQEPKFMNASSNPLSKIQIMLQNQTRDSCDNCKFKNIQNQLDLIKEQCENGFWMSQKADIIQKDCKTLIMQLQSQRFHTNEKKHQSKTNSSNSPLISMQNLRSTNFNICNFQQSNMQVCKCQSINATLERALKRIQLLQNRQILLLNQKKHISKGTQKLMRENESFQKQIIQKQIINNKQVETIFAEIETEKLNFQKSKVVMIKQCQSAFPQNRNNQIQNYEIQSQNYKMNNLIYL